MRFQLIRDRTATDRIIAAWSVVRPKSNMTKYEEHIELLEEIAQANNSVKVRTKELLTQYFGTDDADIRLINSSDLFREGGIRCE
jgi:phosphopantetheine adenylyltransferase